jgi:DinB family protein
MKLVGGNVESLESDMDAALGELMALFARDPSLWRRGRAGKWTAGQHAEHVARSLEVFADALEAAAAWLRAGQLPARPRRGALQSLFVRVVVVGGWMPRGGRAPDRVHPTAAPEADAVAQRITLAAARHRTLAAGLTAEQGDRLWIPNPFLPRWHYTLPESLRVHAVHARHHARQVEEIAAAAVAAQRAS